MTILNPTQTDLLKEILPLPSEQTITSRFSADESAPCSGTCGGTCHPFV